MNPISKLTKLPCRAVFWLHLVMVLSALMMYLATRTSLGRELVLGDELTLTAIAGWATKLARWMLALSILLAVLGRGAAALGAGGVAIGLIAAPVMQFFRDAMGMREIMPELADKELAELVEFASGSRWLAAGIVLWCVCLLAMAIRPYWGRKLATGVKEAGTVDD